MVLATTRGLICGPTDKRGQLCYNHACVWMNVRQCGERIPAPFSLKIRRGKFLVAAALLLQSFRLLLWYLTQFLSIRLIRIMLQMYLKAAERMDLCRARMEDWRMLRVSPSSFHDVMLYDHVVSLMTYSLTRQ